MTEKFTIENLKIKFKTQEDSKLWERFKEGEKAALSIIYHLYYNDLFSYGLKISSNPDLTEDCIQDLFFVLWKNKDQLDLVKSVKAYLFKSFRRKLIRLITDNKKLTQRGNIFARENFDVDFSIEELLIKEQSTDEKNHRLLKAMNSLSPRQKEIIYLRFYKELSYDEIAEVIPLNYQSIRNCVHSAIKILRGKLVNNSPAISLAFLAFLN